MNHLDKEIEVKNVSEFRVKIARLLSSLTLLENKVAIDNFEQYTKDLLLRFTRRKEVLKEVEKLIVDEILICHHENTPTSRLTSLMMKVKNLIRK